MHRLRPRVASTPVSPAVGAAGVFWRGPICSSSPEKMESGCLNTSFSKAGTTLRKVAGGRGGLGVLVRVPGLVKPPSLVSSAVEALLLLHVETHDIPRLRFFSSGSSSIGEVAFECRAEVRSDSFCWQRGMYLEKEALKESWSFRMEGRGVRSKSGGSSTSANNSSSRDTASVLFVAVFCMVRFSGVLCRPIYSGSFCAMIGVVRLKRAEMESANGE